MMTMSAIKAANVALLTSLMLVSIADRARAEIKPTLPFGTLIATVLKSGLIAHLLVLVYPNIALSRALVPFSFVIFFVLLVLCDLRTTR